MQKKLIALAATALCAAGAYAQSSVQLTGLADIYAGSMKMAGDAGRKSVVNSGGMTTSWFGFKGTEDLGGGLKASSTSPRSSRWTPARKAVSPAIPSSRAMPT